MGALCLNATLRAIVTGARFEYELNSHCFMKHSSAHSKSTNEKHQAQDGTGIGVSGIDSEAARHKARRNAVLGQGESAGKAFKSFCTSISHM